MEYLFSFHLTPQSHSDATMFTKAGIAYTPKKKKDYQAQCLKSFQSHGNYTLPILGPIAAMWVCYMPRPKYLARVFPDQNLPHHVKPDGDGLIKVIQDLIQTGNVSHKSKKFNPRLGLIENDSQIAFDCVEKVYVKQNQTPHIKLILWTLEHKTVPISNLLIPLLR